MANMASVSVRLNPAGIVLITLFLGCAFIYIFDIPKLFKCETKVDMKEMLSIGIELAERGGTRVKEVREAPESGLRQETKGKTKEGVLDVKTAGDMKSHREMTYGFRKMYPELNDNLISEEHETEPADLSKIASANKNRPELKDLKNLPAVPISDVTVWIDPLDATKEYTEKLLNYVSTMVCVAVKGVPVIGVVHFPFSGVTYWGMLGSGYSSNIHAPSKKEHPETEPYKVTISRSHTGDASQVIKKSIGNQTELVLAAGAGYKTVQVVKGDVDAYVHVTNIKKWDLCAGNAILRALGGQMTTLDNHNIQYTRSGSVVNDRGVLATLNGHDLLQGKLKPNFDVMKAAEKPKSHRHKRSDVMPKRPKPFLAEDIDSVKEKSQRVNS